MFGTHAWRLGRIGGIEVRIDPSWSFIAFLVAYSFYVLLAGSFPDRSTVGLVAFAALMALVFFGSVLLHELAHSWVARSRGVEVEGITLFLFGGATHARLETRQPVDELVISLVGPVTSLAIAGVLWGTTVAIGSGPFAYATGHLGWVNLLLAGFNMLPGFPLDGGRVLRSLIWRSSNDIGKATRIAARVGQGMGYMLIGLGVFEVLVGGLIGGLWFVAIGWFLSQSAQASYVQLQVRRLLSNVRASDLMTTDLTEIPGTATLRQSVDDFFMRHDHNAFPVRGEGGISGILTMSAVRRVPQEDWDVRTAGEVMEPLSDACTAGASDRMDTVVDKINQGTAKRVIVCSDGEVVGLITPRDISRWLERSQQLGLSGLRG